MSEVLRNGSWSEEWLIVLSLLYTTIQQLMHIQWGVARLENRIMIEVIKLPALLSIVKC